jgi:phenylacetate-CoA ligase
MWKYTEIEQYQFVQKDVRKYVFKVCVPGIFNREQELISEFKSYVGDDADFTIEYVNEIPLLQSGKRKKVVNEMLNFNRTVNV